MPRLADVTLTVDGKEVTVPQGEFCLFGGFGGIADCRYRLDSSL